MSVLFCWMNILNSISKDDQCFTSRNKQYHTVHGFIDKERKRGDKSNPFREQNKKGGSKETIKVVAAEQCIKQGRHSGNGSWEEQSAVQQRWGTVYDASINTVYRTLGPVLLLVYRVCFVCLLWRSKFAFSQVQVGAEYNTSSRHINVKRKLYNCLWIKQNEIFSYFKFC